MKRILSSMVAIAALGVVANARPASACDAHEKTTMTKAEKAQPEKGAKAKQDAKAAKTQQKDGSVQAKSVTTARAEQR